MSSDRLPFPLLHLLPGSLRDVVLHFQWDRERLWRLDLPVDEVAVVELEWHLRLPMWSHAGKPFAISPAEVAADRERFHEQYARIMAADLRFPLHVLDRGTRLTVLDGVHRLQKAILLGQETVQAKRLPEDRLNEIATLRL